MSTGKSAGHRILLVLSLVIIVAAVICCFRFKTEIKALRMVASSGQSDTIGNEDDIRRQLEEKLGITIPDYSDDAAEPAESNTVSAGTDPVEPGGADMQPGEDTAGGNGAQSTGNGSQAAGNTSASGSTQGTAQEGSAKQQIIQSYVNQLSRIQASFQGELNGLRSQAVAQYAALDKSQQTTSAKMAIVKGMYGSLVSLESRCDGQVQSLLDSMKAELAAAGEDTSAVQDLQSYYQDMKASVVASCLAELTS